MIIISMSFSNLSYSAVLFRSVFMKLLMNIYRNSACMSSVFMVSSPSTVYTVHVTYYTLLLSQLYVFSNLLEAFKPFVVQFEVVNQMSRVTKGAEFCCLLVPRVEQPTIPICDKSLSAIFVLYSFRPTYRMSVALSPSLVYISFVLSVQCSL